MKHRLAIIVLLVSASASYSQAIVPDLSWTFFWGTNSVGVVFQTTNLEFAVKSSIRDDIVRMLVFNAPSNSTYTAFNTGDTLFGVVTGRIAMAHALVPSNSPLRYYNTHNGTNFFVVDAVACTNYLTKIALTNQCPLATDSLATFITTLNQVTTNTMSPSAFASLYWSLRNDRAVTLTGDFEDDITGCLKRINDMSTEEHLLLSILDISNEPLFGKTYTTDELVKLGRDAIPTILRYLKNDKAGYDKRTLIWALVRIGITDDTVVRTLRDVADTTPRATKEYAEQAARHLEQRQR